MKTHILVAFFIGDLPLNVAMQGYLHASQASDKAKLADISSVSSGQGMQTTP
jgi:hypothetical protein